MTTTITTPKKLSAIQQHMVEEQGFYFARVTMYRQDFRTGDKTEIVDVYEGFINTSESGIVWRIRPEANMRSLYKSEILTVDSRLISIEKAGA